MIQRLSDLRADRRYFDPTKESVRLHFKAAEDGFVSLAVFSDQDGWAWSTGEHRVRAGANLLIWHGRDSCEWPLPAGEYTLALFGFNNQHGASGDLPLRVHIAVVRHPQPGANGRGDAPAVPAGHEPRRWGLLSLLRRS